VAAAAQTDLQEGLVAQAAVEQVEKVQVPWETLELPIPVVAVAVAQQTQAVLAALE
jgi:hypothetical protein